jgi:hypothetical protein
MWIGIFAAFYRPRAVKRQLMLAVSVWILVPSIRSSMTTAMNNIGGHGANSREPAILRCMRKPHGTAVKPASIMIA